MKIEAKVQDFIKKDWKHEHSRDWRKFDTYQNEKTNEVVEWPDFRDMEEAYNNYMRDYKVIAEFRGECLPFGEYPEYVIQEFLDKKYNKNLHSK